MRLILRWVDILKRLSPPLVAELEQMVMRINTWAEQEHTGSGTHGDVSVNTLKFRGASQTTVGAAGSASALPATPTGYQAITLSDGTEVVIPYYAKS